MDETTRLSEGIERAALEDLHLAAPEHVRERLGLQLHTIGTALVSVASGEPSILVNRAVGLGIEAPGSRETIDEIVALYRASGVNRFYLHLHPSARPAALRAWAIDSGLTPSRGWVKFRRGEAAPPEIDSELRVRRVGREHATDFAIIAAEGFDLCEASLPLLTALVGRPKWHVYMSFAGDMPAGTGTLFVGGDVGWCDWGATRPAYRRRGGQGAVLAQRIRHALDLGCQSVFTATGEAVEGDPQHSYRNILRLGFGIDCTRENFVPATT